MLARHTNKTWRRIEDDPEYDGGYGENIVTAYRSLMQFIRSVHDENDLRQFKSLHFEKLKGKRKHEYSMRVNKQFRLIFQIEKAGEHNQLVITGIEDYH
jgi:proteic killer suppression protein